MGNFESVSKREIFCRYIRKDGKIIYPQNATMFHFWVDVNENEDGSRGSKRTDLNRE